MPYLIMISEDQRLHLMTALNIANSEGLSSACELRDCLDALPENEDATPGVIHALCY